MGKTLVTLVISLLFLLTVSNGIFAESIELIGKIGIEPTADFQTSPQSFCVTEDNLFIFPGNQGKVNIFSKDGSTLKFTKSLGPKFGKSGFMAPRYCFYTQNEGKLGVIDYKARKIFIFQRTGKTEFILSKELPCKGFGYDVEFDGNGDRLIVSGYLADKKNNPFDLYSINTETDEVEFILPSYQKYHLNSPKDYIQEYRVNQTLPAIGIKGFFALQGDVLHYAWEGALKVISIDLKSMKKIENKFTAKERAPKIFKHFSKPIGTNLNDSYKRGKFKETWEKRTSMAYVRDILATPTHVYLIYETGRSQKKASTLRMQIYNPEGEFLKDVNIPGTSAGRIWFDKANYELFVLSKTTGNGKNKFSISKFKIN